jgi:hypothetical protein
LTLERGRAFPHSRKDARERLLTNSVVVEAAAGAIAELLENELAVFLELCTLVYCLELGACLACLASYNLISRNSSRIIMR